MSRWSLVDATTWNVQSQALTFLVAAIAGPAAYAPVAAAIVLFSPLRPAISAVVNVFRPDFASALAARQYRRVTLTLYALVRRHRAVLRRGGLASSGSAGR